VGSVTPRVATVVIGRNESERLDRCLASLDGDGAPTVYVDSQSTDDSVAIARARGVDVVEMPAGAAPSAALARNLGVEHLIDRYPELAYVLFVDGDCVVEAGFTAAAVDVLDGDPGLAAVCGYRVEVEPHRNVFHRIAHVEWQMGGVGEVPDFAGDVVLRVSALRAVGGYSPDVVAGEDTELSSRLVAAGWRIRRLDLVSTAHDIAMSSVGQWWARSRRGGYGALLIVHRNWNTDRLFLDHARRDVLWGVVAPAAVLAVAPRTRVPLALLLARYVLSALRAAGSISSPRVTAADRLAWGFSCSFSVLPAGVGAMQYLLALARGRGPELVEYKAPGTTTLS
jgi:GT2 family glycosyltransferase